MPIYALPAPLPPGLPAAHDTLQDPDALLVACFCAAWCGTCREYEPRFEALSAQYQGRHVFVWIDIEDYPELCGDEDIENFPTLLVCDSQRTLFYGTMLPHIEHLDRLLASLAEERAVVNTGSVQHTRSVGTRTTLPDIRALFEGQMEKTATQHTG
ncbi:MAG: thioredoxin family protein [Corticimicrobacter sp.]|uniref:thioredoxin family protein n=1 Tax=Corticimicrobacter sp. TaxID=2678536 RepID=UPI0032DBB2C3